MHQSNRHCQGWRLWEHLENLGGCTAETFNDQSKTKTPCNMAVIDTNQWVSMEKVWLFNVAPLEVTCTYIYLFSI